MAGASAPTSLILVQMGARLLTFVLNQLLVRMVPAAIFGAANIHLELVLSTILFLSRDAIRNALIRRHSQHEHQSPRTTAAHTARAHRNDVHNISLLAIPIGLVLSSIVAAIYVQYLAPASLRSAHAFVPSVSLYVAGAIIELLCEPMHIRSLALGNPALRVQAESVAVLAKCIASVSAVAALPSLLGGRWLVGQHDTATSVGLLAFGIGQLCYALTMLAVYTQWFLRSFGISQTLQMYAVRKDEASPTTAATKDKDTRPPQTAGRYLDPRLLALCWSMTKQSLIKHVLTESDKFAVARFATLEDQGGYALASNYGSLVARLVFSPIEDTTRLVFAQSLHSIDADTSAVGPSDQGAPADKPLTTSLASLDAVSNLVASLLRFHILLGIVVVSFGTPLSTPFLYILAGPEWALSTSAPSILGAYTWYIPVMGVNGIAEGFLQSTASRTQVERYSRVLVGASAAFVASLWLVHRGTTAGGQRGSETWLVWCNAFSLGIRAAYCWAFIVRYFQVATATATAAAAGGRKPSQSDPTDKAGLTSEAAASPPADIAERLRPASTLPSAAVMAASAAIFVVLRRAIPQLMPSRDILLSLTSPGGNSGGRNRLEAIKLLLPPLGFASACLVAWVGICIIFEQKALRGAVASLRRRP